MARNLITAPTLGLASHTSGRAAVRQGAAKWYLTQVCELGVDMYLTWHIIRAMRAHKVLACFAL